MRLFFVFLSCLFLSACDFADGFQCYQSVRDRFPDSDIHSFSNTSYRFVVRKPDGSVLFVETLSLGAEITSQKFIFPPLNKVKK